MAGLANVYARLSQTPNSSLHWYIAEKPFVLWDWDVRIGQGQHYVIDQRSTITHSGPMLLAVVAQWQLNTLAFCLACIGLVLGLFRGGPERMVAMAVLYVTAVHVVLQAEPRYAIPYRGLEILLVLSACQYLYALAQATMASIEARIDAVSAL